MKKSNPPKPVGHHLQYRPIVIPKPTCDRILELKIKPGIALALYTFYYYTGIWQETNKPKCTISYAMSGLGLGKKAIQRAKDQLTELGLIEYITVRGTKNGRDVILGHFIRVRYYDGSRILPDRFSTGTNTERVEKSPVNAYSTNNRNAYSTNSRNAKTATGKSLMADSEGLNILPSIKKTFAMKMALRLFKILKRHKVRMYHMPNLSQWAGEFTKLRHIVNPPSRSDIREALDWYDDNFGKRYCPEKITAATFCRGFAQIEMAMDRQIKKEMEVDDLNDLGVD